MTIAIDLPTNAFQVAKLEKLASRWWMRIAAPVEIKLACDATSVKEGSSQLCQYMRLVLRNQLDRRFVFGLLVCDHYMRVFYCDRSGLLVTDSWIDINKVSLINFGQGYR